MFHIQKLRIFSENMTRFYGAEITLAVGYLHDLKIIYRDVKVYRSIDNISCNKSGTCSCITVLLGAVSSGISCYYHPTSE